MSNSVPIYTIGYGTRSIEDLIALLRRYGIQFLIDIRSRPYSSFKPEFSRETLAETLKQAGFRYVYMGDVIGGQPLDRNYYDDKNKVLYELYSQDPTYKQGIKRLLNAWAQQLPVALMCSEEKPTQCHRSKLLGLSLENEGVQVLHIDEKGDLKTQSELTLELNNGQLSLLPPSFTSRKKSSTRNNS